MELVAGKWQDIVTQAEQYELDGLAESGAVESRLTHFLFTNSYNTIRYAAATVPENAGGIQAPSDLKGKRIAHLSGNILTN